MKGSVSGNTRVVVHSWNCADFLLLLALTHLAGRLLDVPELEQYCDEEARDQAYERHRQADLTEPAELDAVPDANGLGLGEDGGGGPDPAAAVVVTAVSRVAAVGVVPDVAKVPGEVELSVLPPPSATGGVVLDVGRFVQAVRDHGEKRG